MFSLSANTISSATGERGAPALGLMVASGCASLGLQIVWTQQSSLWLGHESVAVLAVVAAFFGGLALGSLLLGSRIEHSERPVRWYAGCEIAIGGWNVVLVVMLAPVTAWLLTLIGPHPSPLWHWSVVFVGIFLLLLPATAAMGATLPAMQRMLGQSQHREGSVAALYAGNTFGAVIGVLAATFWLIPQFGLMKTAAACTTLNLLCALSAMKLFTDTSAAAGDTPDLALPVARSLSPATPSPQLALSITGLLGIGYEVLVVRVLSQAAENTVYTFAILLAVYLVGTALGAAAYGRWLAKAPSDGRVGDRLQQALAVACSLGILSLADAVTIKATVLQALGNSMTSALLAEAALAAIAFLLPTILMGALFSHLSTRARLSGISFGRALGVNTVGAAAAPLLFGMLLAPLLGAKAAALLIAVGYLLLSSRQAWTAPVQWAAAAALAVLALWAPRLIIVDVPEGGRIVSYSEGAMGAVSIVEDARGVASLHIDNRQQEGSSATLFTDARQGLLPILLHPNPHRALFVGLGTGVTALSASQDPQLQVDAVELLPQVVTASAYFTRMFSDDTHPSRLHIVTADARRYMRTSRERYDVIVADNFHPARSGSGSLYTLEHFTAVRARLTAHGIFCQWLPLHQLDVDTLRSIVRTFNAVYPRGWAILATNSLETPTLGLIARNDDAGFDLQRLHARLSAIALPRAPADFGITDDLALFGNFIAGPHALARFAGDAPLNTDDLPVVTYRAPRITYLQDSLPRERLLSVLSEVQVSPGELFDSATDVNWNTHLAAYWNARNRFLEAGKDIQPSNDVQRMLAQVHDPLMSVLHISPDFRPAYDPLLRMATALGRTDARAARALLVELQQVQPSRSEAGDALREFANTPP